MTLTSTSTLEIDYPDSDGLPMAESDLTRDTLIDAVVALRHFFRSDPTVYVSGNLFIYYEQGNNKRLVAPDVFVIKGVSNQDRRSYKAWEENGKLPDFVMEITSLSTAREDQFKKRDLYQTLGVQEYWLYDPSGDYLDPRLQGYELQGSGYHRLSAQFSQVLGLELRLDQGELFFWDPVSAQSLPSPDELRNQLDQERQRAKQADQSAIELQIQLEQAEQRANRLADYLRSQGLDPDTLK